MSEMNGYQTSQTCKYDKDSLENYYTYFVKLGHTRQMDSIGQPIANTLTTKKLRNLINLKNKSKKISLPSKCPQFRALGLILVVDGSQISRKCGSMIGHSRNCSARNYCSRFTLSLVRILKRISLLDKYFVAFKAIQKILVTKSSYLQFFLIKVYFIG